MKVTVVGGDAQMQAITEAAFRRALPSGLGNGMSVKLTVAPAPVPPGFAKLLETIANAQMQSAGAPPTPAPAPAPSVAQSSPPQPVNQLEPPASSPVPRADRERPLQTPDFPFDAMEVTRRASAATTPPWYQRVWSAVKRWMALD